MTHDAAVALILALCRSQLDDAAQAEIADLLTRPLDWDEIAELAALHGVVGLVRRNLLAMQAEDQVPARAWKAIEAAATQVAFDGVLQLRETDLITATLHEAGIEAILLKGMALGDLLYEDPLVRPSADIDLLVAPADLAYAEEVLASAGYLPQSPAERAFQSANSYHISLVRQSLPGRYTLLELHWDLGPRNLFRYDLAAWRSRAQRFSLAGCATPLLRFSPEDQLLHLALHMRKHRYVGLRWLVDVAELLRRFGDSLNWPYVTTVAEQAGLRTLLYTTVTLAGQLLGSVPPGPWLERLAPSPLRQRLLRSVLTQDALTTPVEAEEEGWTRLAPAEVLLLDKPGAMARELRFRLMPPPEKLAGYDAGEIGLADQFTLYSRRLARRTSTLLRRRDEA